MGGGAVLFALSLLYVIEAQGLQHVFVLHGKDLHLDIKKPVELDETTDLFWKFNNKNNIVKITPERKILIYKIYEGRAEFGDKFSLLLKNVQHSDSGHYAAVTAGQQDQTVAEYKVTVQDPVSSVDLTVTSNSSDSCNLTVTCSTADLKISRTFRCDAQNCSQVEEESLSTAKNFSSLIVYLQQDTIFCNHSNKVSWIQSNKVTKLQCEPKPVPSKAIIAGAFTGVVIVSLTVMIVLFIKCKRGNTENTVYEVPQDILPDQNQRQPVSGDASCQSPTSTYALVDFHTGPETTKTKNTHQPETVYAQVNRAAKLQSTGPTTNTQS